MAGHFVKEKAAPMLVLAVLAIGAYLPVPTQPFISDDYPNIGLALVYGPISGWRALANDAVQRPRATTFIFAYAIHHLFGLRPAAFYSANILLHVLNCWLLLAAGRWPAVGYRVSFWAAAFFAVYEGHSEAIMWFSACNELLMFLFGFLSFLCWLIFLERERLGLRWPARGSLRTADDKILENAEHAKITGNAEQAETTENAENRLKNSASSVISASSAVFERFKRAIPLALSFFFFLFALLSKESAVIFVALFTLPLFFPRNRSKSGRAALVEARKPRRDEEREENLRLAFYLSPHVLVCVPYVVAIFMTSSYSFRFQDRSFVLSAPFWVTWTKSYGRMLWFWGLLAAVSMLVWSRSNHHHGSILDIRSSILDLRSSIFVSFIWIGIGFIPYMFVDYMHRLPSRQTYLASAGLAWMIGAAIVVMKKRYAKRYKWAPPVVLLLILSHNVGYLWTKKRQQFLERAQPTERLLSLARSVDGPIFVKCFPNNLAPLHAEAALKLVLGKPAETLIWSEEEAGRRPLAATFCYEE